jgi:hypothetical protein
MNWSCVHAHSPTLQPYSRTDVGIYMYEACNDKSEILPQIGDAPSLSRKIEDRPQYLNRLVVS